MSVESVGNLPTDLRDAGGCCLFCIEKIDGTLRRAKGTLQNTAYAIKGTGRPDDGKTIRYYDVEAGGFRSFRAENLITIY